MFKETVEKEEEFSEFTEFSEKEKKVEQTDVSENTTPSENKLEKTANKIVVGIRTFPTLKLELTNEAESRGMKLSEYGEMILAARNEWQREKEQLIEKQKEQLSGTQKEHQAETEVLKKTIQLAEENNNQITQQNKLLSEKQSEQLEKLEQVDQFKKQVEKQLKIQQEQIVYLQNQQNRVMNDPRLNHLFEKLRGTIDTVKNANGEDFPITYESPSDVLIALIYASNLNLKSC